MIDYKKSAELNNCSIYDLKVRFKKFPSSSKKVVAICNKCRKEREVRFVGYRDLCLKCSRKELTYRFSISDRQIKRYTDPTNRKVMSDRSIEQWSSQEARDKLSEINLNSDAAKIASERQRGGFDLVCHHYLYDHADLSKYTMSMTRSEHAAMHNRMRGDGYKVPHINSETDDNELMVISLI